MSRVQALWLADLVRWLRFRTGHRLKVGLVKAVDCEKEPNVLL